MKNTYNKPVLDLEATGKQIKYLRKSNNISVKTLQEIFFFTNPQSIYNWEAGKNMPSIDNLLVLADLFNVSIEDIVKVKAIEVVVGAA